MIEKEIIGSKGPISHVFIKADEDLPKLNCLGRHHLFKISKGDSFMTGFLQAEFVFDDPYANEACGEDRGFRMVYDEYIKALTQDVNKASLILRDYVAEYILVTTNPKIGGVTEIQPIVLDLENTAFSNINIPIFADMPEIGSFVVDVVDLTKHGELKYSGTVGKTFTLDGVVRVFLKFITSSNKELVEDFVSTKEEIESNLLDDAEVDNNNCLKEEKTTVGYYEIIK